MKQTNFREFFMKKLVIVFQPEDIEMPAKDFFSTYASYVTDIGLVGKKPNGYALYPSKSAPVEKESTQFFEEWVDMASTLSINSAVTMDFYTDGWFARDPKYQTMTAKGQAMKHQICPNREEFWQYGAEIVKEIGSYPVNEIFLFGAGFIRDQFCFCERCRREFAPQVGQEPNRLTYEYITENPEYHALWHKWRTDKIVKGLAQLQAAARDTDQRTGRAEPLRLSVEVILDPETGLSEGAKNEYGYDYVRIGETTGGILINLFPWSPILPKKGSKGYSELVESLYYVSEFKRKGGHVSLFRWGVTTMEHLDEIRALGKDVGINRIVTTFHYPGDYSVRREAAIGSY